MAWRIVAGLLGVGAGLCLVLLGSIAFDAWMRWRGDPDPTRTYWKLER